MEIILAMLGLWIVGSLGLGIVLGHLMGFISDLDS